MSGTGGVRRIRKQSSGLFSRRTPEQACEGRGRGDRRRHRLLCSHRSHRQARLRHQLQWHKGLDRRLPTLRRRPHLHRHPPLRPLPRPVVPVRERPPPELDARLRPDDGEVPPGRPAGVGGRGERVWVCGAKSGEVYRSKGRKCSPPPVCRSPRRLDLWWWWAAAYRSSSHGKLYLPRLV